MNNNVTKIDTTNNKLSLKEVKFAIWKQYGNCIKLRDEEDKQYSLEGIYVFILDESIYKHNKEFSCSLKDLLYRNYYWIDSKYKKESKYDNLRKIIEENNLHKNNKEFGISLTLKDGYELIFYPDYVNLDTKKCLHYFDMSWFRINCNKFYECEWIKEILEFFNDSTEYDLIYYASDKFERDYN